jgi:glutamine synthetase
MPDTGDVAAWLDAHGITQVRLQAVNHDGFLLGKYMAASKLLSAAEKGTVFSDVAFGIDATGEVSVGWDWGRWRGDVIDIKVMPDLETLIEDPALEGLASVMCEFTDMDGNPLPVCFRSLLRRLVADLADRGFTASMAAELEFTVFEEPIQEARARRYRDLTPLGGATPVTYLLSKSHDLTAFMDAVVRRLLALGIPWESWSNETAPGQVELNLDPSDPVAVADQVTRAKLALREVAAELGHTVTFMARVNEAHFGAGMHVNQSLCRNGANAFYDADGEGGRSAVMRQWLAGLLETLPGSMSLVTPNLNSFRRLVEITGPPTTVTWADDNKTVALRALSRDPKSARIENRVASGDCNVYAALAVNLAGGLIGLDEGLEPPPPFEGMAWALPPSAAPRLPTSIKKASAALLADRRLTERLGQELVDYWVGSREWEWTIFHTAGGDPDTLGEYEYKRYFEQT